MIEVGSLWGGGEKTKVSLECAGWGCGQTLQDMPVTAKWAGPLRRVGSQPRDTHSQGCRFVGGLFTPGMSHHTPSLASQPPCDTVSHRFTQAPSRLQL